MKMGIEFWLLLAATLYVHALTIGDVTQVYRWVSLDYDWPDEKMKTEYITAGKFILKNNILAGIKLYKDEVYLTVPRWRPGVPSTLNRVVTKENQHVLQPYPSWDMQKVGECSALQYVQSMEIDPNTGHMWILDNGRIDIFESAPQNLCPPKLLIWDIERNREVHRFVFPADVASPTSCFLNDIVLDYVGGRPAFAYITDTMDAKLYVYNREEDEAYFFQDPSMQSDPPGPSSYPIDGIAIAPAFDYVYYCPITGLGLFQIPTSVLRNRKAQFGMHVRRVGTRLSRSDGLAYGQNNLFYGLLDLNGIARWEVARDAEDGCYSDVTMTSQAQFASDNITMRWVDTFAWDDKGYLWFVTNDVSRYLDGSMNFSSSNPNMYINKLYVNDSSYLSRALLEPSFVQCPSSGARQDRSFVLNSCIALLLLHYSSYASSLCNLHA